MAVTRTTTDKPVTKKPIVKDKVVLEKGLAKNNTLPTTIQIGSVEIVKGKRYVLGHKFDASAPDGMKGISATKFPFEGNDTSGAVFFDESRSQYDTGFYKFSKCNDKIPENIKEDRVNAFIRMVKEPYEQAKNVSLDENESNKFWKEYRTDLYVNREFNTDNILELFDLYNAVQQGYACSENEENPFYRLNATFTVTSPSEAKNKIKDKTKKKIKGWDRFTELLSKDRGKLDVILLYLNRAESDKMSDEDLKVLYYNTFNSEKADADFIDRFLEACDMYNQPSKQAEMEYFIVVNRLLKAGKIRKLAGKYMTYDEQVYLGNTTQDIAKFCRVDEEKRKVIEDLYESITLKE